MHKIAQLSMMLKGCWNSIKVFEIQTYSSSFEVWNGLVKTIVSITDTIYDTFQKAGTRTFLWERGGELRSKQFRGKFSALPTDDFMRVMSIFGEDGSPLARQFYLANTFLINFSRLNFLWMQKFHKKISWQNSATWP